MRISLLLLIALSVQSFANDPIVLPTDHFKVKINEIGQISSIFDCVNKVEYLAKGQTAPFLTLQIDDKQYHPTASDYNRQNGRLTLTYADIDTRLNLTVHRKSTHITFEIISIDPADKPIDLVIWGPYPTTIGQIIGETIGVVRNDDYAIGIQAMNPKTIGGSVQSDDRMLVHQRKNDPTVIPDIAVDLSDSLRYMGDTATYTDFGSILQAYCRSRSKERTISNWGHADFTVKPFDDGGIIGSKIALFGCPVKQTLDTIGKIEIAENLPHPIHDGQWAKTAPTASESYIITDFSESNIEKAVEVTKLAGLRYLYNSSPFRTWGHFKLKPSHFPNNWDSFKNCVDIARKQGVGLGFHTLSNFITTNDPYVTPKPDRRLAVIGTTSLSSDVNPTQKEIQIDDPAHFNKKTALNALRIGDELVQYASVSAEQPFKLLDCKRGAWGTKPDSHKKGQIVSKLMDHGYNVFLTDADLAMEVARKVADFCNHTGALQLSFDGLEGNWSTGMGAYGRSIFTKAWFDHLKPELKGHIINDASNPNHYNWHIYTRMNWGEPWYGGFRQSQQLYRLKNQPYYSRNLMPRMLGWFSLRPDTSVEDAEWLLARAAGFNAGFALALSIDSLAQQQAGQSFDESASQLGAMPAIMENIRHWETARMQGLFPPSIRASLQDVKREFHLEPVSEKVYDLYPVYTYTAALSPQSPDTKKSTAQFELKTELTDKPLSFILRSTGKSSLQNFTLKIDDKTALQLENELKQGQSIRYTQGPSAQIYNNSWRQLSQINIDHDQLKIKSSSHIIKIAYESADDQAKLDIEFRIMGDPVRLDSTAPEKIDQAPITITNLLKD
ncbi:MAG: hypothetical protein KAS23_15525 [Anaerohalosphaera sp.]|nr:hypothetical protein [Anaerohalosphaera sp.]